MALDFVTINAGSSGGTTSITLTANQRFIIIGRGRVFLDGPPELNVTWNDPEGFPPTYPNGRLEARIGAGAWFDVGRFYSGVVAAGGALQLRVHDTNYGDNLGQFQAIVLAYDAGAAPNHDGCGCGFTTACADGAVSASPISLQLGEKREEVTDLSLNTPAGVLAFTRSYRQSKLATYQTTMGLGWTHNHDLKIDDSVSGKLLVQLPGGGEAHFSQDSIDPDLYLGDAGSNAAIVVDTGSTDARYILTTSDESIYVFDHQKRLRSRQWPTAETWTYAYYTTGYANGKLQEVDDGYERKLQFTYIDNSGQYDHLQLWRVGDHTATGLDGSTPTGRYIEFRYTNEKLDGSPVTGATALLHEVQDVLGNTWMYRHYGQAVGEDASDQANFLIEVLSPSVDTDGDGAVDGRLALKHLTYTLSGGQISGILQARGFPEGANPNTALMRESYAFQGDETTETIEGTGLVMTHYFVAGQLVSTQDAAGVGHARDVDTSHYRPTAEVNANAHVTTLEWSSNGKLLDKVTDALNQETAFTYDTEDRLIESQDAEGRITEYTYGDSNHPRQPTEIRVYDTDGTTLLRFQKFTYDSMGRTLTEQMIDPSDEVTGLQEVERAYYNSGDGNGLLHTVTQTDIGGSNHVTTTYTYDSAGRVVKTQQSSNFGTCEITYTVYDDAGNIVASICNYDPGMNPDPTDAAEAVALYDEQNPDVNRVTTHEYDTLGRRVRTTVNAGASFAQTTVTLYDALDRVVRTLTNFVDASYNPPADWVFESGVWKDEPGGTTIAHGSDNTENLITDTAYNVRGLVRLQRDVLGQVTLYGYDAAGRLVRTVRSASNPDYNNDYNGTSPDADLSAYPDVDDPDQDIITEQVYDAAGNLVQAIDPLGRVTFTHYDALNRPTISVNNYVNYLVGGNHTNPEAWQWSVTNNRWQDSTGGLLQHTAANNQNLISSTEYDALGRVIQTRDINGQVVRMAYDPLGRQTHQIVNYVAQGSSDPADWLWNPNASPLPRWEDGSGNAINHGADNDQNLITLTVYNAEGRVAKTIDVLGNETHYAYDGLGRQIETILNYEDGSYTPSVSDEDLIRTTAYDTSGRVFKTVDPRGNVTLYGYDDLSRQVRVIQNASNSSYNVAADPDLSSYTPAMDAEIDQDRITVTEYDAQGRVLETTDPAGVVTRYAYDALGRRIRTVTNYTGVTNPANWLWDTGQARWEDGNGNAINFGAAFDQNLVSETTYDRAGRVAATRDARGTQTPFTYDRAGRRLTMTQAAGTPLATTHYTCYDKAGQVRRTIQNWTNDPSDPSPDAQGGSGSWLFAPTVHGQHEDENLITEHSYDSAGRRISVIDPLENTTQTAYFKDGQVNTLTDPEGMITASRYDQAGRRKLVVQSYAANGEDPALWVWDGTTHLRWERSNGTAIVHGANNDQNVIVQVSYDKAGRMTSLRDPRGNVTAYAYDALGRRLSLTNPLSIAWETAYSDLASGGTRTAQTLPGVNGGSSYTVQRDFDRLGRLSSIQYGDPANTPDVAFAYDAAGNRSRMTEYGAASFTSPVRETLYGYDDVRRLTSVGFDTDADSSVDETVSYEYDAGGLRTRLTLPGGTDSITYSYNARGELVSLTDWDDQASQFAYDNIGRHIATLRPNGLRSRYTYDAASRLRLLRHTQGQRTLGHFAYEVDGRGNRTQALEMLPHPVTTSDVTIAWDDDGVVYRGSWTDDVVNGFKETDSISAALRLMFFGSTASLTFGVGPDHSIFDVYIGKTLWESFDGYAAAPDERTVDIPLTAVNGNRLAGEGPHLLELRNRPEKNAASSGYSLRFKQLLIPDVAYDLHTIQYQYDALSRLLRADYHLGIHVGGTAFQEHVYSYDLAGNLVDLDGVTRTFNAANQMTHDGTNALTYDDNGNLTSDGVNSHTWDRANRLLAAPGSTAYQYDGNGNRIRQTVSNLVTDYLLDVQPGLAVVLRDSDGMNTNHYIHAPRGVHSRFDGSDWSFYTQDGLGSVRGVVDAVAAVTQAVNYTPVGVPDTAIFGPAFTGEWRDESELQYHRARYLSPEMGTFLSLDPFEGMANRPMSLNGYNWVEGNVPNRRDPSGLVFLTFDDGPHTNDNRILDILRDNNARATFFFHGANIDLSNQSSMDIVWRVVTEGHRLGNHSYEHTDLSVLCLDKVVQSVIATENNIRQVLQRYKTAQMHSFNSLPQSRRNYIDDIIEKGTGLFRAPGGDITGYQAAALNCQLYDENFSESGATPTCPSDIRGEYNTFYWDVDPADWQLALFHPEPSEWFNPVTELYNRIFNGWDRERLAVGGISVTFWSRGVQSNSDNILLHSWSDPTVSALPAILSTLQEGGYTFDLLTPGWCSGSCPLD